MRRPSKVAIALASFLGACATAHPVHAASMDPAPGNLVLQPPNLPAGVTCQQLATNPELALKPPFPAGALPNDYACLPNNVAWANLMSELGMAIAPSAMGSARTTGFAGFVVGLEAKYTSINKNAVAGGLPYWRTGTQGGDPGSLLQVYSVEARKGLPFGFEVAGSVGYVANTSLWVWGADVHWALLEGYRTGVLGYLPDVAIGAGVRSVTGASTFYLTTLGLDGRISKPIALAGSSVLTPHLGVQRVIIFADSASVDLTPNVDAYAQCGYQGTGADGMPKCSQTLSNGSPNNADFNDTRAFERARIHRWRGMVGLDYRYELLYLAGQLAIDLTDPSAENAGIGVSGDRQWSFSVEAGVFF